MKTYKFKNATVLLKRLSSPSKDRSMLVEVLETIKHIKSYQNRKKKLSLSYQGELKSSRKSLSRIFKTRYEVQIKLTKYNFTKKVEIELENGLLRFGGVFKQLIQDTIREYRRMNKLVPRLDVIAGLTFETMGTIEKGMVFSKPGQVYEKHVQKKVKELYTEKRPVDICRYIGLELEFCAPINETDLALKLYSSGLHKIAQLKHDGSLRPLPEETGFELAVLFREGSFSKDLKRICDLLMDIKAETADRRCGLHVHLDMRRRKKEVVYGNLVACQDVLLGVVDPSRTDNEFCRLVNSKKFPTKFTGSRQERYKTINAASYYKYKTLEIRMHQGSIDYSEIKNWMNLLIKIANYKNKLKYNVPHLTSLKKRLKLKDKIYSELVDKSCYWQVNRGIGGIAPPRPSGISYNTVASDVAMPLVGFDEIIGSPPTVAAQRRG